MGDRHRRRLARSSAAGPAHNELQIIERDLPLLRRELHLAREFDGTVIENRQKAAQSMMQAALYERRKQSTPKEYLVLDWTYPN